MNPWATKRKLIYISVGIIVLLIVVVIPTLFLVYEKPTCFDGRQNGDETGVDCGGSCQLLCSFEAVNPRILWSRAFKVTDTVYSAVAYVENPNINSETFAPYVFHLYDAQNNLIGSREGTTYIQKNKVVAVFEPNILTNGVMPARVSFEFKEKLVWNKNTAKDPELMVTQKILSGEKDRPRIDATVENKSLEAVENIELVAIVYDNKENAIASSRTYVDNLDADEFAHVAFTWPQPFTTTQEICRVQTGDSVGTRQQALGVMLAIDRSGSMASQRINPPQPLTSVKDAAAAFVRNFQGTDRVGVVSFASEASDPIDATLSTDHNAAATAVQNIAIAQTGTQFTNIADGLNKSYDQLFAPTASSLTDRVIVLLTDGDPTKPEKAGDPNYPSTVALQEAERIKQAGAEIFTIGLGQGFNTNFLKRIATDADHFYNATSSADVAGIYEKIAVKFCSTGPSVVEIIPRIIPR